jgi:hypothetical protein
MSICPYTWDNLYPQKIFPRNLTLANFTHFHSATPFVFEIKRVIQYKLNADRYGFLFAYCVYLSHCVLCVPQSLCSVCTWVTAYCVYLSHCVLCVPESLCICVAESLRIVRTWVIAYCVYLSHCVLCVPESLRIVCTWVIVYCVYLSHCVFCVPESLFIVCTWVTAYCVYLSHCLLCVAESLCMLEDKNPLTKDVQNNQSFYFLLKFPIHFPVSLITKQN